MLFLLCWLIYGILIGLIAKAIHPGEDPVGFGGTLGVGIAGSYLGGFLTWLLGGGTSPIAPSGILMGVLGGVIFCWMYRKYRFNKFFEAQGRMPKNLIKRK